MNSIEITPGNNGTITSADLMLFHYTPSDTAAYAYMGLFGVCTFAHFIMMFPLRSAYFIPFVIGGISKSSKSASNPASISNQTAVEVGGYYGRAWAHDDVHNFKAYILQSLLLLVAPTFLAATVYMILGRFMTSLDAEHLSMIRPKWLSKLFVLNDVICFLVQIGGARMQATTSVSIQKTGGKVVIIGLVLQILVFCWFILIAMVFHKRLNSLPTDISLITSVYWKREMWTVYLASIFILVRNIVRVVEYTGGSDGAVQKHEVIIYIFDATLMFLTMLAFNIYHPGFLLKTVRRCNKLDNRQSGQSMAEVDGKPLLNSQRDYLQIPNDAGLPQPASSSGEQTTGN